MTNTQYQLNSNLPFDVSETDAHAQKMLNAAPAPIWTAINSARGHEAETAAYDKLGEWISANYSKFFPKAGTIKLNASTTLNSEHETFVNIVEHFRALAGEGGIVELSERKLRFYGSELATLRLLKWHRYDTKALTGYDVTQSARNQRAHFFIIEKPAFYGYARAEAVAERSADNWVKANTAFASMQLMMDAEGGYRPSLRTDTHEAWYVADEYDRLQASRGDHRRAARNGTPKPVKI